MSTIAEILDRLSGVAVLKERLAETNRNVDRSLAWLLDHERKHCAGWDHGPTPSIR